MMGKLGRAGMLVGLLSLVLGCARSGSAGNAEADIRGRITSIHRADVRARERGIIGFVFVDGIKERDTKFGKASVRITNKTGILKQEGQDWRPVTFESLKIGQRVEVRFTGPVMKSYPVQANAIQIVILK